MHGIPNFESKGGEQLPNDLDSVIFAGLVNRLSLSHRLPSFSEDLPSDAAGLHVGDLVRNLLFYRLSAFSRRVKDVSLR